LKAPEFAAQNPNPREEHQNTYEKDNQATREITKSAERVFHNILRVEIFSLKIMKA
jgi:hypothetical protein